MNSTHEAQNLIDTDTALLGDAEERLTVSNPSILMERVLTTNPKVNQKPSRRQIG